MNVTRNEFESKAPLVNHDELVEIVTEELLTDKLQRVAAGVWLTGSFVNSKKPLDTGDSPSDMDLLVPVCDWEYPIISSALALVAPQVELPKVYDVTDTEWKRKTPPMVEETFTSADPEELPSITRWDCSAEDAWNRLPDYVCTTLERSINCGFYASKSDAEARIIRSYHVVIGPLELFDVLCDWHADKIYQLWENERVAGVRDDA